MTLRIQVGGALREGGAYVRREADGELPQALAAGELCYVLAPRQIGKSSLRVRVAATLRAQGFRVASVDLSGLGAAGLEPESWFYGLASEIASELDAGEIDGVWASLVGRPPAARWLALLERLIVAGPGPQTVLFLDEIDAVLALPFGGEDLLTAIRAALDRRASDRRWERLNFCLLGVAAPGDLIRDPRRTPFNVGRAIRLEDFSEAEARALAPVFGQSDGEALLRETYAWTHGHPFQTMQIAAALAEDRVGLGEPHARIERVIEQLYCGAWPDPGLDASGRILRESADGALLSLYRRCLMASGLRSEPRAPAQTTLLLSGLVAIRQGRLVVRNRVVSTIYDPSWVEAQQGRRELRAAAWRWVAGGRSLQLLASGDEIARLRRGAPRVDDLDREEAEYLLRSEAHLETQSAIRQTRRLRLWVGALALLGLLGAVYAFQRNKEARWLALAQDLAGTRELAQMPGKQEEALRGALTAWFHLSSTPFAAAASRALADTVQVARALPLGGGGAFSVAWMPDGALLIGRADGRLERRVAGAAPQDVLSLEGGVSALAVSVDGQHVIAGGGAGDVAVWEVQSGRIARPPVRPHAPAGARGCLMDWDNRTVPGVREAAIAQDGRRAWTRGGDGSLWAWELATELDGVQLAPTGVLDASFSSDGALIAAAGEGGQIDLYAAAGGALIETRGPWPTEAGDLADCDGYPTSPAALIASDSAVGADALVVVGRKGQSRRVPWDARGAELVLDAPSLAITAVAMAPDGRSVATSTENGEIALWDLRTGEVRHRHADHRQGIQALRYAHDGALLASTGHDDTVRLWDTASGALVWTAWNVRGAGLSLAFSPDDANLAVASPAGAFVLSTAATPALHQWSSPGRGRPSAMDVSEDGSVAVAWTGAPPQVLTPDGAASAWAAPAVPVLGAEFSPDGAQLAWVGATASWIVRRGGVLSAPLVGSSVYRTRVWSPRGDRLLLRDGEVGRVTSPEGEVLATLSEPIGLSPGFSPDGARLVARLEGERMGIFDVQTGGLERVLDGIEAGPHSARWSDDGRTLAIGTNTRWITTEVRGAAPPMRVSATGASIWIGWIGGQLWTAQRNGTLRRWGEGDEPTRTVASHSGSLRAFVRSPDQRTFATAGEEGEVRLWSADGDLLAIWHAHRGVARHLVYARDGATLYTAGDDGRVVQLPGSPEALVAWACAWFTSAELSPPGPPCD